jgi:hypothetical protein
VFVQVGRLSGGAQVPGGGLGLHLLVMVACETQGYALDRLLKEQAGHLLGRL